MQARFPTLSIALLAVCLFCTGGSSFASQTDQAKSAAPGQEHGFLVVELAKTLNSRNLTPGASVEATVQARQNGMSIPRGSKVVGHVTEVKSRSKGDTASALGIVFDTITPPAGASPTPIKGVVTAVAPNPNSGVNSGGGSVGPRGLLVPDVSAGSYPSHSSVPLLNEGSTGVLGIKNLQLGADGVLTSDGKEIKLERGTQVLLRVTIP